MNIKEKKQKMVKTEMSLVSLVKNETEQEIKKSIQEALELIQYKFPKNIKHVVVKPNMCYYWDYTTGQTTHPKLVTALIELIREQISSDVKISLVEADASAMKCKYAFKFLGFEKIAKDYGVELVNLSEVEAEPVEVQAGTEKFQFMVPKIIKDADLRINLAKSKFMEMSQISVSLKNIFGCNPYPKKFKLHNRLSEAIVGLNKVMPFDLTIFDGLIVPGSPTTKLGLIMASQDSVAMDATVANIMGVNPKSVKHIMLAEKEGIGKTSFIPRGMELKYFKELYPKKSLKNKTIMFGYKLVCRLGLDKRLNV